MIGEQILNYQIIRQIGEGGMGKVYLASHIQLDRKAAVKALHPVLAKNPLIRERFKNEAATMAHLRHTGIVALYDYWEAPNGLYLIMEYAEGEPLEEWIRRYQGKVPLSLVIEIFIKILDAVAYAHKQGVVHRDIKPSNIMVTPEGEVKILDFGIAKLLDGSSKNLTHSGTRLGTVLFMSPEQVKGQDIDQRSDVYSLGITLYQMIAGQAPYDEKNATEYGIFQKIVNEDLPPLNTFQREVPDWLQDVLNKATAKNPGDRFQTCEEFKKAILMQNTRLITTPVQDFIPGGKPYLSQTQPIILPKKKVKKRSGSAWWVGSLLLFLLLAAGIFALVNPFRWEGLPKINWFNANIHTREELRAQLENFYKAVESHDFEQVRPFYSETLENYFGNKNRKLIPDIRAAYLYYWKRYTDEEHAINWEQMQYSQDDAGGFVVILNDIDYRFKTEEEDWKSIQMKAEIRLDKDLKIFSIQKI